MPTEVLMPALSPTMTEGKLAKWLKKEGDEVRAGDVLAEIETDKATMEVEAVDEGKLGRLLVAEGTEGVKVNTPIAVLLGEGEDAEALGAAPPPPKPAAAAPPAKPAAAAPPAKPAAAPAAAPAQTAPAQAAPAPAAKPAPSAMAAAAESGNGHDRVFASPLARRMAQQAGLELAALRGSGPHGRIVKADIEAALGAPAAAAPRPAAAPPPAAASRPSPPPAAELPGAAPYTEVPHSSIRKIIARRLTEAKQQQPHFYLTLDCEIDALLKLRQELNAKAPEEKSPGKGGYKLSVNDFVIRAVALALRKVPAANASWTDEAVRLYQRADISVAVAIPNGLITPIIRGAERKGLAEISNEMRELAGRAREGKLKPEEFQGGTFSISNLGMYGIREFAAVHQPAAGRHPRRRRRREAPDRQGGCACHRNRDELHALGRSPRHRRRHRRRVLRRLQKAHRGPAHDAAVRVHHG